MKMSKITISGEVTKIKKNTITVQGTITFPIKKLRFFKDGKRISATKVERGSELTADFDFVSKDEGL